MKKEVLTTHKFELELPLGHRIKEILCERGDAFSVPAFSKRIGMSESTLYRCINGQRPIKPSELHKIAEGLTMTIARIKMEDTMKLYIQMKSLIHHETNIHYALDIALQLLPLSCGYTEKYEVLNSLGAAYYHLGKYKDALNSWGKALDAAQYVMEVYQDYRPYYNLISNLILGYGKRNDFSSISTLLSTVEVKFDKLPSQIKGTICYSQAMAAFKMGDLEQLEHKMYQQLEHFIEFGETKQIATALNDVAYMLFVVKKYENAKLAFERAIEYIRENVVYKDSQLLYISNKDYARTLYRLHQKEKALKVIHRCLVELGDQDSPIKFKLLLLDALYAKNMESAKSVLVSTTLDELRAIACKLLMHDSFARGDAESLMSYYKIGDMIEASSIWKLEELL